MDIEKSNAQKNQKLRKRAEAFLSPDSGEQYAGMPGIKEASGLMHEQHTHQIELELQNDELRKIEMELTESRDRYAALYDFAPVGYLTVDNKGLIVEANLTVAVLLDVERQLLINQPFSRFIVDGDQDIFHLLLYKLIKSKEKEICEIRLRGKEHNFAAQLEGAAEAAGEKKRFRICVTDISDRKRALELIEKSKLEWQRSFDAMSDLVNIVDKDMKIIRANKAMHTFFQADLGKLAGKTCYSLFCGGAQPCPKCPLRQTMRDKQLHSGFITHKKSNTTFHIFSSAVLDENDNALYYLYTARDVTEQKKLEAAQLQSHKMEAIGTMAGGIAHDFNNILQGIFGFAELAHAAVPTNSPAGKYLEMLLTSATRAKELISQILIFSRNKPSLTKTPLEPYFIIKEVVKMMRSTLPAAIKIEEDLNGARGTILADPVQLHQIVLNLFTNAFHAIQIQQGPGEISITLADTVLKARDLLGQEDISPGSYVELTVRDTGCGMPQEIVDRIFEPYFTTREVGEGTGMGLTIIHGIVKDLGGMITVASKVGRGSTFRLYFPCVGKKKKTEEALEKKKKAALPTGKEHILVVDDEATIVALTKKGLQGLGYRVTGHTSGLDALQDFRSRSAEIDLVITDQSMPDINGDALIEEIRKIKKDVPVIICTGDPARIPDADWRKVGATALLMKPVPHAEMAGAIRKVLQKSKPA
jgi:PAS domain S-box-containing protein